MKPSELILVLPELLDLGIPVFIWGHPGVGKSDSVRTVAAATDRQFLDIRASLYEPPEMRGYPIVEGTGKSRKMRFVPAGILPSVAQRGLMLLDELPQAIPAMHGVLFQLTLDGKIGEYELPEGWAIVAAGNYPVNGGAFNAISKGLGSRFLHINLHSDQGDWDAWANGKVDDITRAFLRFRPNLIHDMTPTKGFTPFPSSRSWVMADKVMQMKTPSQKIRLELLEGCIGEGAATERMAFQQTAGELPDLNELLLSPDTAPIPSSPAAKYAVATLLESKASKTNFKQCLTYMERLDKEYQTAFMHNITKNKREMCSTSEYTNWCLANKEMLGVD